MVKGVRLEWEGKRAAQTTFAPPPVLWRVEEYGTASNRLIQGDNLAAMAALRNEMAGQFRLIYLDPPFFTGGDFYHKDTEAQRVQAEEGEGSRPTPDTRHPAFSDDWDGDMGGYLQWMLDRLTLARELLAEDGCLYVHLSWHAAHYVKLLLDEIFGAERFQNEIVWCYREAINAKKRWNRKHDTLLFYSRGERFTFNYAAVREAYAESHIKKYKLRDEKGLYRLMGRGIVGSPLRSKRDLPPACETEYPGLTYRHYLGEGTLPVDYWQIDIENQASLARTGYPTQKPEALLERILRASSNPGDLVGDFCCGSGTTLAVAARLGRRWIGCDFGALAIHTTRKRLLEAPGVPDFAVERLGVEVGSHETVGQTARTLPGLVQEKVGAEVARLRLTPEARPWVDMWAIQSFSHPGEAAQGILRPFRPQWWSARTRRSPQVEASYEVRRTDNNPPVYLVALTNPAGVTTVLRHGF